MNLRVIFYLSLFISKEILFKPFQVKDIFYHIDSCLNSTHDNVGYFSLSLLLIFLFEEFLVLLTLYQFLELDLGILLNHFFVFIYWFVRLLNQISFRLYIYGPFFTESPRLIKIFREFNLVHDKGGNIQIHHLHVNLSCIHVLQIDIG